MREIFAYAVPFLSLVFALGAHWKWRQSYFVPCCISAVLTGAVALLLYALAGKGSASFLYVLIYSVLTGFVLALLVGFLLKYAARWFR